MNYIETIIETDAQNPIDQEIFIAELAEIGYESFVEDPNCLKAYIQETDFSPELLNSIAKLYNIDTQSIKSTILERENWNQQWESNYTPIEVDRFCYIRAPFHENKEGFEIQLIIEPKMSFGTGHHNTTQLMIRAMKDINYQNKKVLDMGCGTGILALVAAKQGAKNLTAIDIDAWAVENSIENFEKNDIQDIDCFIGDGNAIKNSYDIILANINRNILLKDMGIYANHINSNGLLLISGFYISDNNIIIEEANKHKFQLQQQFEHDSWSCLVLKLKE